MNLTRFLVVPLLAVAAALPAQAEKLSLAAISAYFNAITTAQAEFTQINDDGSLSTGQMFIRRPGRIRFEYNPPDASLVMAGQGQVAVFDSKSNQPPEQFPLVRTPLFLILAKDVDLNRAKMVVAHTENGTSTSVVAQDPEHPEYGFIELVFTANPVALRQWVVADGSGQKTTVILGAFDFGRSYPTRLFNIRREIEARGF